MVTTTGWPVLNPSAASQRPFMVNCGLGFLRPPWGHAPWCDVQAALVLLKSSDLAERMTADLAACGVVGEVSHLLTGYLTATSRKLDTPLAVLIQSSSAAGKSALMDAVLNLMPPEERVQF